MIIIEENKNYRQKKHKKLLWNVMTEIAQHKNTVVKYMFCNQNKKYYKGS